MLMYTQIYVCLRIFEFETKFYVEDAIFLSILTLKFAAVGPECKDDMAIAAF